jgi:L-asparaginase/Glu-tRNA(Gln) amidotransferase subunit D
MASVEILALGGTIAMEADNALTPKRQIDAIMTQCSVPAGVDVQFRQLAMVPGAQVDLALLRHCAVDRAPSS